MAKNITKIVEVSSPVIKYQPSIKTKILGILIPFVMLVGVAMIVVDRLNVGNARGQNAWKAGGLLLIYCIYSLRGLFNYRIFLTLTPEEISWTQGFPPFKKSRIVRYKEIRKMEITSLTSTLIFTLSSGALLKLSPSVVRIEGELANVIPKSGSNDESVEKTMRTDYPAVRELFFLKNEIQRRVDRADNS